MPEDGLRFEWADPRLPNPVLIAAMSAMFRGDFTITPERFMDEPDQVAAKQFAGKMMQNVDRYSLLVWKDAALVGWSVGFQSGREEYYMQNSAVLPEYRKQGIYTRILHMVMDHVRAAGAQKVYSYHRLDNSAVLIAKLKAGFSISGIEISDRLGPVIVLSHYFDPRRRDLFAMRAGSLPPPAHLDDLLDR